nr:hypothetical protein [Tanacetum cinerariifolium]
MSQLPEFISHHIMSFLDSSKDSVLSKYWFRITASFPISVNLKESFLFTHAKMETISWTSFSSIPTTGVARWHKGANTSACCIICFFINIFDNTSLIDIEAPNLCCLQLSHLGGRAPCLNVASCKKLTIVCYYGDPSPTWKGLADFSSDFPYLKTLFLDLPEICDSLKLSSHSLTTFVLHSDCDLEQLDIDTPNLLSFEYTFSSGSPFAMKRDSVSSKSLVECHPLDFVDALWFKKLRRFLDKKVRFKELKLCLRAIPFEVEELRMIQSPPFELDHIDLEPELIRDLSAYLAVVDGLLSCCRPPSLTLESGFSSIHFEEWSHIVKFTYEKLLIKEDQGQTNIRIVTSSSSNAKKHFSDLTSLLTALPRDGLRPIITFIKEQVVQEAG